MSVRTPPPLHSRPVLERIEQALAGLEFGAVEITVHHGRIVQIERREKVRLEERRGNPRRPADSGFDSELTGTPEVSR